MKVNKILILIVFGFLISLSACFKDNKLNEKEFSISDTESITKIIMSDKAANVITLKKEKENWIINNKYKVWQRQIDYTLGVMKDIRIKSSVSEQKMNFVIQNIATTGVKVEIFEGEERIRSYYIGGNTSDHLGTFMIVEGAKEAYILDIPDRHPGILNPKYGIEGIYLNETIWREPITISITADDISEIKVDDLINTDQSFTMNISDKILTNFEEEKIQMDKRGYPLFASFFNELECGSYKPNLKKQDLILIKKIFITHNNTTDTLLIFDKTETQKSGEINNTEVKNLFASWNNSEIVIIQKNIFNNVLITLDEIKE